MNRKELLRIKNDVKVIVSDRNNDRYKRIAEHNQHMEQLIEEYNSPEQQENREQEYEAYKSLCSLLGHAPDEELMYDSTEAYNKHKEFLEMPIQSIANFDKLAMLADYLKLHTKSYTQVLNELRG